MDEDKFALVEKIIKDIDNVMSKNAELCAFDIVPVECNFRNKSPVLHLENCLGLESWCVKHVYMYCYNELMDKYLTKKRKSSKPMNSERLGRLLNVTLLINPELNTLWNKRRELFQASRIENTSELQFSKIVLSRKPKCNEAYAYRRWLLQGIVSDATTQTNHIENLINEELRICEFASDRSPNNYHSWSHRMWVLDTLKNQRKQYDIALLYIKEYGFSERWASKHVSDFSCFHYRQFCIKNILTIDTASWKNFESTIDKNLRKSLVRALVSNYPDDATKTSEDSLVSYSEEQLVNVILSHTNKTCNCTMKYASVCSQIEVLFYELVVNNELLRFYKHHETLWYHRRFVVHELVSLMYDYFGFVRQNGALVKKSCRKCYIELKQVKIVRYDCNRVYSSILFNVIISHEKRFVAERSSDGDNYADRHEKYLKFVEGLNNFL